MPEFSFNPGKSKDYFIPGAVLGYRRAVIGEPRKECENETLSISSSNQKTWK
jgi:hypothetical protein